MRSPPRRAERLLAPRALPMAKPAGAGREVACGLPALPMANPAGARGEAACGTRAAVGEAGRRARRRYMRVPRCQWRSWPHHAVRVPSDLTRPVAIAGAAAPLVARLCQNHPRTSVLSQRTSRFRVHAAEWVSMWFAEPRAGEQRTDGA